MSAVVVDVEDGQYTVSALKLDAGDVVCFRDVDRCPTVRIHFSADPND
jgi:hypothetical protein